MDYNDSDAKPYSADKAFITRIVSADKEPSKV